MKTLENLVGQMMIIGWSDNNIDSLIEIIEKYHFGNFVIYERNFDDVADLKKKCEQIQDACMRFNGKPAFICVDQEGGVYCSIRGGITPFPCNMAVAAASGKIRGISKKIGQIQGAELKSIGINCNFAPVVDVTTNPYNSNISTRSYSDNPSVVASLATEYAKELQSQGVMSCYKHFLGHGDSDVDARLDLPRVKKTLSEMDLVELVPFKTSMTSDAIIMSHILYANIDDKFPASVSRVIQKELVRGKLGFGGLIISDCFEMGAIFRILSPADAAVFAVSAGTDMLLSSNSLSIQLSIYNSIINSVNSGTLSMHHIQEANKRIEQMKEKYCTVYETSKIVSSQRRKNDEFAKSISRESLTLINGRPFVIADAPTVVIGMKNENYTNILASSVDAFRFTCEELDVAKDIGEKFNIPYLSIGPKRFDISEIMNFYKDQRVILCLVDSHKNLAQRILYNTLQQSKTHILLVSMGTPYDVLDQHRPDCHICCYEYTKNSIGSLIKVLSYEETTTGACPVKVGSKGQKQTFDNKNYLVENIVDYIRENFKSKLSLEIVAREFFISGTHLCKLIKSKLGKNFVDVVNDIRIAEAKILLSTTKMRLMDIAPLCGFTDINYFNKVFRSYVGCNPSFYRNSPYVEK